MTTNQEIENALAVLEKHNVCFFTIPTNDFKTGIYSDLFNKYKLEPTDANINKIETQALYYLSCESIKCIEEAIEYVSMRNSLKTNKF